MPDSRIEIPVVHRLVIEDRTAEMLERFDEQVETLIGAMSLMCRCELRKLKTEVRDAYLAGVRDGFQKGVDAEAARHPGSR